MDDCAHKRVDVSQPTVDANGKAIAPVIVAYVPPGEFAAQQAAVLAAIDQALAAWDLRVSRPAGEISQALALGQPAPADALSKLQGINTAKANLRVARAAAAAATEQAGLAAVTWQAP